MCAHCSQEVWNDLANRDGTLGLRGGVEDLEGTLHALADVEQGSHVTASVAVVRGGPDSHEVGVLEPVFESVHDELMSASNQVEVVDVVEFRSDLGAEEPSSTSRGECPGVNLLRIRPHQVAERSFMWNLHSSFKEADLIESLDIGRKTTVDAKDFTLHNGANTQVVKNFAAVLPWVGISVFADSLVVESVHRCDLSCLVVSAEKSDVARPLQFEAE